MPPFSKVVHIQRLASDFSISVEEPSCHTFPGYEQQIAKLWEKELKKRRVFNGEIFSIKEVTPSHVKGQFVRYDSYIAQLRDSSLQKVFEIFPLGVSAILQACDQVLIACRSDSVTQYPGFYELAPSGSLDKEVLEGRFMDYKEQIIREMEEETGINRDFIDTAEPLALIHDQEGGVMDLCSHIKLLDLPHLEVKPTEEYHSFTWIPCSQIFDFMMDYQDVFVPTSLGIINEALRRVWI